MNSAKQGALVGLRRSVIPFAIAIVCFALSFWGIDDMVGLLRGVGAISAAVGVLLILMNAWQGHSNAKP
ncbi:MAG TPA: hypothetical protein PKX56_04270 [Marmoricola sp.]|nr:hypothetical protein [Marmoricola sp.]HNJ78552.1 hypothetical protein [Marmoricola sp.]HNN48718.1 hypothetical protein [Marmoricola sp.]